MSRAYVTRRVWLNFLKRTVIDPFTDCWLWQGPLSKDGYASYRHLGMHVSQGHAFSHDVIKGKPPEGYQRDHLCRVRNCVNYNHIEVVLPRTNSLRGDTGTHQRRKICCPQGHLYSTSNIYWHKRNNGTYSRRCVICCTARGYRKYSRYQESKGRVATRIYYSDTETKRLRWMRVQG